MTAPLLEIAGLHAWYGESHILHGVDLEIRRGEVVTLLGRNGAGRTTTLRAIMGLTGRRKGSIKISERETIELPPHRIARLGVGYCPEERGVFASLSTEENLMLPPRVTAKGGMSPQAIFAMFPNLEERRASPGTKLSGGEQQMLAVARILRTGAELLLLDEISLGLAPLAVDRRGLDLGAGTQVAKFEQVPQGKQAGPGPLQHGDAVERDELPTEPAVRKGVPQGAHVHGILKIGRECAALPVLDRRRRRRYGLRIAQRTAECSALDFPGGNGKPARAALRSAGSAVPPGPGASGRW